MSQGGKPKTIAQRQARSRRRTSAPKIAPTRGWEPAGDGLLARACAAFHAGRRQQHPLELADRCAFVFGMPLDGSPTAPHDWSLNYSAKLETALLALVELRRAHAQAMANWGGPTNDPDQGDAMIRRAFGDLVLMKEAWEALLPFGEPVCMEPARRTGPRAKTHNRARDLIIAALARKIAPECSDDEGRPRWPASELAEVVTRRYGIAVSARTVSSVLDDLPSVTDDWDNILRRLDLLK